MIESWLKEIEQKYKIDILFAVETGSRVWGSATSQSDYDIRFIYKHDHIKSYLSLEKAQETIEFPAPYDAVGWDIFKAFHLLEKSNANLLEWAVSPIVYRNRNEFAKKLQFFIEESYSLFSLYQHYIRLMARNVKDVHHKEFNEKRQKQLIQAVRSFLLAKEIVLTQNIPFDALYGSFSKTSPEKDTIVTYYQKLMDSKRKGVLLSAHSVEAVISRLLSDRNWYDQEAIGLPKGRKNAQKLNKWIWDLLVGRNCQ